VHVIISQQRYDDPGSRLPAEETVNGVHVRRAPTTQFGRSGLPGRGLDYLSFYASAWRLLPKLLEQDDILVAMTDLPLVSIVAMRAAQRRGAHLVNWLQHIYPEVAVQLGISALRGPIGSGLSYLRDRTLRKAAVNIVVGQRMLERISSLGISTENVHVIHNWSDDEQITPVSNVDNPLRQKWGLHNKFVVGCSGNLGRAH